MTSIKTNVPLAACALLFVFAAPLAAQQTSPSAPVSAASADNTSMNQRDRSSETTKPTDQPNDQTDIKVAAAVRRAILNDKSLSTKAHNVKLVAANGVVTLRGPVANADEKTKVEGIAAAVAGVTHVDNQLDVKH
jgi:hyperosmotically inducible protein